MNPGAAGPGPLTLPLHETAIVATAVITFAGVVRWFQDQRHLTAGNADAVGVLIARRVAGRPYHEVDAGFGPGDANTELVKVVYDEKTWAVLAAEAEVSARPPDEATQRAIRAGGGLVVFR